MFMLVQENCWSLVGDFDTVHEKLRENGCHSPTDESIIKVFRAVKALTALARLQGNDRKLTANHYVISTEMLIKQLNGPKAELNISGNGFEFTGWHSEIFLFIATGLLNMSSRTSLTVTSRFIKMFCSDSTETSEATQERFLDYLAGAHAYDKLRDELINRIHRFGLINLVLAGTYANRN